MSKKWKPELRNLSRVLRFIGISLFFLAIFILLLSKALNAELNHDEHQFVASGKLLADQFSFPYIDYPFHHMPNLVLIYALLFKLTNYSLLGARFLSVACATLSTGILFYITYQHFYYQDSLIRNLLAVACVILLISNPLFESVSGKAWNHDLPTLLILLSFAFLCRYDNQDISTRKVFFSGILLGLAIGSRLSYATVIIPYIGAFLIFPSQQPRTSRYLHIIAFSIGVSLGLLPSIVLFIANPKFFIFGNVIYPKLNPVYRNLLLHRSGMTITGKIIYFLTNVISSPLNMLLYLGLFVIMVTATVKSMLTKTSTNLSLVFAFGLSLFLLIGSFGPTPSWYQYYYAPIPFLILGIFFGFSTLFGKRRQSSRFLTIVLLLSVIILGSARMVSFDDIKMMNHPNQLLTIQVHNFGMDIKSLLGEGKILTLAPIIPLEGGLEIYEAFTTGPFTWRTAFLLAEEKREEYGVISHLDLEGYLENNPPDAILVGFESKNDGFGFGDLGGLEKPLTRFAIQHGYEAVTISTEIITNEIILWVR